MNATMILADYAQIADGKLNIIGGGWGVAGQTGWQGIGIQVEVGWDETNRAHTWELRLVDGDGVPATMTSPMGPAPLVLNGEFELGRPAGVAPGASVSWNQAWNFAGIPLAPGGRYEWLLTLDGAIAARRSFSVIRARAGET